jgi:hypothetical protein
VPPEETPGSPPREAIALGEVEVFTYN